MTRPNLLKIDDVLLRAARTVGLLWLLACTIGLGVVVNAGSAVAGPVSIALLAATAPLGLLIAGLKLRRREGRAWALHRLVDDHVEISASDLLRDSDFTPASVGRAIRDLNNAGAAFLVWDRKADVIQDGRLRRAVVQVEECGSCSAKVSVSLRIGDVRAARCPYCHDPLDAEGLLEEKARLIDELDTDPESARPGPKSSFSLPIFVVLTFVFWPLAVGYALWHWHASPAR